MVRKEEREGAEEREGRGAHGEGENQLVGGAEG